MTGDRLHRLRIYRERRSRHRLDHRNRIGRIRRRFNVAVSAGARALRGIALCAHRHPRTIFRILQRDGRRSIQRSYSLRKLRETETPKECMEDKREREEVT